MYIKTKMILKRKIISLIAIAGLFLSPQLSQAQVQITLKEALNYAVSHNTNLKKSILDIDAGKYKTQEVRSQALPQLTATSGLTYNPVIGQIVFGDQAIKLGRTWNSNAGVSLNQQLFNQQVFTGLQAAKSSENYYALNAELTEEQVIEQVANNYYQVLVNRIQMNVIDTNIKNVSVVAKIINNQFENGLAKKIDVDRIQVSLTNLNTQRETIKNAITQLENNLKLSMGMSVNQAIIIPETEFIAIQESPIFPDSLDMSNRTEMKLFDVQSDLLRLQKKAFVSEYYPTLSLMANYNYATQSNKFDYLMTNPNAIGFGSSAIGLTLRVPIFNGFLTRSKIRQADIQIAKLEEDRFQAKNGLNMAYENAKIQMKNSLNTINLQRKNVELAQEIYLSTQNNYNNGLAFLTDLLETENSLTQAQNSYNQALLNYKIAEIQFIKSQGNIKSLAK